MRATGTVSIEGTIAPAFGIASFIDGTYSTLALVASTLAVVAYRAMLP